MKRKFGKLPLIALFSLLFALFASTSFFSAFANENEVLTDIFLPTSYLEYYKLQNPYAICRFEENGEEVVAISHDDAIVIYRDEKFRSIPLDLSSTDRVKTLARYKHFLLYLYDLRIYAIDLNGFNTDDWQGEIVDTGINAVTFSICDDRLLTATGDNLYFYDICESDGSFSVIKPHVMQLNATKTSNVLLAKDGKVYYTSADDADLMVYDFKTNSKSTVVSVSNIRFIAEGENRKIYFTSSDGVYEINGDLVKTIASVSSDEEKDLGKIYNPYGVCYTDKNTVWIVDGDINAVQEIDVESKTFTQFAITTNSQAVNRLSGNASDICEDDERIYALDGRRIITIKNLNGEKVYGRINLDDENVGIFSAGDGKICYLKGDKIKLFSFTDNGEPDLKTEKIKEFSSLPDGSGTFGNVSDIYYSENNFYIIRTVYDHGVKPEIYVLSSDGEMTKKDASLPLGKALQITVDVFGDIYFACENDGKHEFYAIGKNGAELLLSADFDGEMRNLQTDFAGSLYALYDGNRIIKISDGVALEKTIVVSDNLTEIGDARSFCLSYRSTSAYFIFSGLILDSSRESDLAVSTPDGVEITESFKKDFVDEPVFIKPEEGVKIFIVSDEKSGLDFKKYLNSDGQTVYAICDFGKYCYAVNKNNVVLLRSSDAKRYYGYNQDGGQKYCVVGFDAYAVPVTDAKYKTDSFVKNEKVEILGEIDFNGRKFAVVSSGERKGFIPSDFLSDAIISDEISTETRSAYFYGKNGVPVYADKDGNEIVATISDKTRLQILSEKEGKVLVLYNGEEAYIESVFIVDDGKKDVVKAIITVTLAFTLMLTAIFLERRFLYGKKEDK